MAYRALYRTWRPSSFAQAVGQTYIIQALKNQVITRRIAHAYLFCGSRGTGKTSFAKIFARAVNCEHPEEGDLCGKCAACLSSADETTLDIIEIDAASNNGVDEIRDLREKVKYPPQLGVYKVYIIDEVHMLSPSAFNALLKTLEEPPEHVIFILATTEPQRLPATILSRCQRYDFGRLPAVLIAERLREAAEDAGVACTSDALQMIAVAAEGGMRDAFNILDMCMAYTGHVDGDAVRSVLGASDKGFLFAFTGYLVEMDLASALRAVNELMRSGKDPSIFAKDFSRHLRALLLAGSVGDTLAELLETTEEEADAYRAQADSTSAARLMSLLELFIQFDGSARYASSPRMALEMITVKACSKNVGMDTQALAERLSQVEAQYEALQKAVQAGVSTAPAPGKPAKAVRAAPRQTAEPSAAPAVTAMDGSAAQWDRLINEIKKKAPGMLMHVRNARFIERRGDMLRVAYTPAQAASQLYFNNESTQSSFAAICEGLFGEKLKLDTTVEDTHADEDDGRYAPLYETFGEAHVIVRDE